MRVFNNWRDFFSVTQEREPEITELWNIFLVKYDFVRKSLQCHKTPRKPRNDSWVEHEWNRCGLFSTTKLSFHDKPPLEE